LLGPAVPSLDANELIWEFFAQHPLAEISLSGRGRWRG
jgi:poly(3-hydroxybutyrate) depolymerase